MRDREKRRRGYGEMRGMEKKGKGRGGCEKNQKMMRDRRKREKKREKERGAEWEDDERQRKERGGRQLHFRSRVFSIYTCFFFNAGMVKPVRFGSVQSVSDFENRNRTEPGFFLTILIGLIGFFFGSVFSVNFFSVYSVFRFFCTPLLKTPFQ